MRYPEQTEIGAADQFEGKGRVLVESVADPDVLQQMRRYAAELGGEYGVVLFDLFESNTDPAYRYVHTPALTPEDSQSCYRQGFAFHARIGEPGDNPYAPRTSVYLVLAAGSMPEIYLMSRSFLPLSARTPDYNPFDVLIGLQEGQLNALRGPAWLSHKPLDDWIDSLVQQAQNANHRLGGGQSHRPRG